jgi:TolB-like protein/Tfp pilus assembly protein PilF
VLPFPDLSAEEDRSYLGDGIAEELLNILARVPDLKVAARTSSFSFRGRDVDLREVGRELGVSTVLEGSVRREGDQFRITAQLIDARDGFHLWSETYDRNVESLLQVQEEIASAIAQQLRLPLQIGPGLRARMSEDPEAYETYLRARALLNNREIPGAESAFRRALDRDSAFAAAWGGLAEAIALRPYYGRATFDEALGAAERAARRALELDSTLVSAHVALANVLRDQHQWSAADRAYLRALELNSDDPEAVSQYAQFFSWVGDAERTVEWAERAHELDPLSFVPVAVRAYGLLDLRRWEEAEEAFRQGLALNPGSELAGNGLLLLFALRGEEEKARELAPEVDTEVPVELVASAVGNPEMHPRVTDSLLDRYRTLEGTGAALLVTHWITHFGSREQVLGLLERQATPNVLWRPTLDPYRDDPRFQALLEQFDLPYEGA